MAPVEVRVEAACAPVDDRGTLPPLAPDAVRDAEVAARRYQLAAWTGYALLFAVIPFVVVLFRARLEAWHYYLAAGLFLAIALATCVVDLLASAMQDKVAEAAEAGARERGAG